MLNTAIVLAASTADAYSFDKFGAKNWTRCCESLLAAGYHAIEADAILRSKLMRLAADDRRSVRARATADDMNALLNSMRPSELREWIDECIVNINFPEPEPLPKFSSRSVLHLAWSR